MGQPFRLDVSHTWDGQPVAAAERATLRCTLGEAALRVEIDAPWHGDRPPAAPPGSVPGLWEHEVVELMLLGADDRYLELEFGPHGHYLALQLHGVRHVVASGMAIGLRCERLGARWRGLAEVDAALLPAGLWAANAFALHGGPAALDQRQPRRFLAAFPAGGTAPDFHVLTAFAPIASLPRPEAPRVAP